MFGKTDKFILIMESKDDAVKEGNNSFIKSCEMNANCARFFYFCYLEEDHAIVKIVIKMADERIGAKTVHPVTEG